MDDDDFIELNDFILEMTNVDFYLSEHFIDDEIVMKTKKVEVKTPIQLLSFDFLHLKTKNPSTPLVDQVGWNTQLELGTFLFTINAGFAFTLGKNKK